MAKKKDKTEGTGIPKSPLAPAQVHKAVEEGRSDVIPFYCFHYGDPDSKPPVESRVCHKIDVNTLCCTTYTGEHTNPKKKCRFQGFTEDGQPQVILGCPFSPYEYFERMREAWATKGFKINPLKAAKRARRGK
jgi:hypothetical protein